MRDFESYFASIALKLRRTLRNHSSKLAATRGNTLNAPAVTAATAAVSSATVASAPDSFTMNSGISPQFGESPFTAFLPVDLAEEFLIRLHDMTGLPWWLSLSVGALCFRLLVAPATLIQLRTSAKLSRLRNILGHCVRLFVSIPNLPRTHFRTHSYFEALQAVKAAYGVYVKDLPKVRAIGLFLPMFIAIPTFMTYNIACRKILASDLSGLTTQGPMWCPDLTMADPTNVFPILALAATVVNLHFLFTRIISEAAPPTQPKSVQKHWDGDSTASPSPTTANAGTTKAFANSLCFALQGLAVCVTPFLLHLPAGMFLYWIIAMSVSTLQNRMLRTNVVRRWAGFNQPPYQVLFQAPDHPLLEIARSAPSKMLLLPPVMSVDKAYSMEIMEASKAKEETQATKSSGSPTPTSPGQRRESQRS